MRSIGVLDEDVHIGTDRVRVVDIRAVVIRDWNSSIDDGDVVLEVGFESIGKVLHLSLREAAWVGGEVSEDLHWRRREGKEGSK